MNMRAGDAQCCRTIMYNSEQKKKSTRTDPFLFGGKDTVGGQPLTAAVRRKKTDVLRRSIRVQRGYSDPFRDASLPDFFVLYLLAPAAHSYNIAQNTNSDELVSALVIHKNFRTIAAPVNKACMQSRYENKILR